MKVFNLINAKGKTVRIREDDGEVTVDAAGRYFSVPLSEEGALVSVSVTDTLILLVTVGAGLTAYNYAGQAVFTLDGLAGTKTASVVNGTVMDPFEALALLSRVAGAPLAKEHVHYYCSCADGTAYLIDLAEGKIIYTKSGITKG